MTSSYPDYGISFPKETTSDSQITAEEHAKNFIQIQVSDPNYTHQLDNSQLWSINKDNTYTLIATAPDVYFLLEKELNLSSYLGVIIHTTGWASPLNEDGTIDVPPSENPNRRRVALAACITNDSSGSALSFNDQDEIITDPGTASGTLAEALLHFWEKNNIIF